MKKQLSISIGSDSILFNSRTAVRSRNGHENQKSSKESTLEYWQRRISFMWSSLATKLQWNRHKNRTFKKRYRYVLKCNGYTRQCHYHRVFVEWARNNINDGRGARTLLEMMCMKFATTYSHIRSYSTRTMAGGNTDRLRFYHFVARAREITTNSPERRRWKNGLLLLQWICWRIKHV